LGRTVGELRGRRGLSQAALAGQASSSPARISEIEEGRADPELAEILALARALGVPAADLLADELT